MIVAVDLNGEDVWNDVQRTGRIQDLVVLHFRGD